MAITYTTGSSCVKCKISGDLGASTCQKWATAGINTIYFLNNGGFTYEKDTCGNIQGITLCAYACMYKATIIDETGVATLTTERGQGGYTTAVEITSNFVGDDCSFYDNLESYLNSRFTAIVAGKNKKFFAVGLDNGLTVQTIADTTGTAPGDVRAVTVTFTGSEPALKQMVLYGTALDDEDTRYALTVEALSTLYEVCNTGDDDCVCLPA